MVALMISTTLVLLCGYLVIDSIEFAEESILAHLGLHLFSSDARAKKVDDIGDGG